MKYLVIGISGSGKSSVREILSERGYNSHEIDELARWENDDGAPIQPPANPHKEMFEHNHWNVNKAELKDLLKTKDDIYVCGSPSNLNEIFDLFDRVFLLKISESTLRQRLSQRKNNDFGKHPEELVAILSWHDGYQKNWFKHGAKVINAEQPTKDVVNEILKGSNG